MPSTLFPTAIQAPTVQHPVYVAWAPVWRLLVDVFEGTGGFMDGTNLVAHPREWEDWQKPAPSVPTKKLKARRLLARYENLAATILDQKRSALFRESITRSVAGDGPHPIEEWWENVDGYGCSMNDWMAEAFVSAALFGHVFHYMDRAPVQGVTAADDNPPYLRMYTPLDVPHWLQDDRGQLIAVKLLEATPMTGLDQQTFEAQPRERIVDQVKWELRQRGTTGATGTHMMGTLPIVVQYAKRRGLSPLIGHSVLGDPKLYVDLYNLTSEIRELLREQTFGITNVQLGTGAERVGVEEAQLMMGTEKGPSNIMFTPGPATIIQPDTGNVTVYQAERTDLMRAIYRLAAIPWESDSKDAEAEGSLKLKREDMNQVLASYAAYCQKAEVDLAQLWFRAQHGPDAWEAEWERAEVTINYPQTFDVTPFQEILEQATAAQALPMGPTFTAEMCKRLIEKFIPDVTPDVLSTIEKEIDQGAKEQADLDRKTEEAKLQQIANPEPDRFAA